MKPYKRHMHLEQTYLGRYKQYICVFHLDLINYIISQFTFTINRPISLAIRRKRIVHVEWRRRGEVDVMTSEPAVS